MLSVLDGAVLVLSAVEGVQPQTRILMRALQRLRIPTLLFVNKIDRRRRGRRARAARHHGAADDRDRRSVARTTRRSGARSAEVLAERDEAILAAYVESESVVPAAAAARRARRADEAGARAPGLLRLRDHGRRRRAADGRHRGAAAGSRGRSRRAASRDGLQDRTRRERREDRLRPHVLGHDPHARPAALRPRARGQGDRDRRLRARCRRAASVGRAQARSPSSGGSARSRSATGSARPKPARPASSSRRRRWSRSSSRDRPDDGARLRIALAQLAEQDPLINVRQDDSRREISVSLYGEVQKEVIQATLADDFGLDVTFRETTPIYIERPVRRRRGGRGAPRGVESVSRHDRAARSSPRRTAPGSTSGCRSILARRPLYLYKTLEGFSERMDQYVRDALQEGLFGWQVTDCVVTMTRCTYSVPDGPPSTAGTAQHGRRLPQADAARPDAGARAGRDGGLRADRRGPGRAARGRDRSGPGRTRTARRRRSRRRRCTGTLSAIETVLPAVRAQDLQRQLPGLTGGEGVLDSSFAGYRPVERAAAEAAARTDRDTC